MARRSVVEAGASVAVWRGGAVVARASGRGIGPLLALLDARKLCGAVVCDKVVGRAAAAICVAGGAQKVCADLMSAPAAAFLKAHGVPSEAARLVPQIDNRDRTGPCPMEGAVRDLEDPAEMVGAIRQKLEELKKGSMK